MSLADLALDPAVSVDATFLVDRVPLRWVEPAVGLFLAPELVALIEQLAPLVDDTLRVVTEASALGTPGLARDGATALLQSVVGGYLKARPATSRWIDMSQDAQGRLRLAATAGAFDVFVAPDRVAIRLSFDRRGDTVEREIPLSSARALSTIMDLLRGDYPSGVDLALADRGVRGVIAALESIGALVPSAEAGEPFVPEGHVATALTVTHMGHAFLIVDGASRRVLFDPVLHAWRDGYAARPITPRQLGPVDAIFFTQHHLDHMDLASLLRLPHRVPVYVPGGVEHPLAPRSADYLRTLGFADVREIHAGDTASVGDLRVHALPFTGKGRDVLGYAANVYIVSLGGERMLVHADASPDSSGRSIVSSGELARQVFQGGPIRAIYATWWQRRRPLCALSPLVLLKPDVTSDCWLNEIVVSDCSIDFLASLVRTCRARRFVTYAEGGRQAFLPAELRWADAAVKAFLGRPRGEVCAEINRRTGVETLSAQPYQQIRLG
jgi:hypothetical protein